MASVGVKVFFRQDIKKVWEVLTSVDQYKTWRTDLKEIEIIDDKCYVESTKDGYDTSFTVVKNLAVIVPHIILGNLKYSAVFKNLKSI